MFYGMYILKTDIFIWKKLWEIKSSQLEGLVMTNLEQTIMALVWRSSCIIHV